MSTQELDLAELRRMYGQGGWLYTLVSGGGTLHWGWTEPGQSKWRLWRAQRQLEDVLGRKLALPTGARVLDAGCGAGVVAQAMAARFGLEVAGVDVLDFLLDRARRSSARAKPTDRTTFRWGDFHQLPFDDGEFDGGYAMEALVHSYDPPRALAEFHRVLRPGGRLVLLGPMSTGPLEGAADPDRSCHAGSLPGLLAAAGFEVEEAFDATRYYRPTTEALHAFLRLPWELVRRFGDPEKWLNIRTIMELYAARDTTGWYVHTAVKPSR
ncbi:class I SAM-dependent methyltransferase [Kitasatospora sp. NPDC094011]|uniref:class I SAM-dependent methyltransferase n=1 Tax=Kitasatospora sp. NPDC094011 TaxID=3364090 RepID=UPI003807EEA0